MGASTKLLIFVENRVLDATVSQKPEIAFSPCVGVNFFFRSHAAWEHHFSFFQHLCAARYVFFDFLARRASVETSEGSLCNLHVFIQYPTKKIGVTLSESSTRLANLFFFAYFQNDRFSIMPYLVRPRSSRRLVFVALEIATCPLMPRKTTIHVFEIIFFERPRNRSRIKKCLCACVHLHLTKSHFRSIRDDLESIRKSLFSHV